MTTPMANGEPFITVRDMVAEIRDDVKAMAARMDKIDREGSIGTKAELVDHESRLRILETSGSRLRGAWEFAGISAALICGLAGLALSALHLAL